MFELPQSKQPHFDSACEQFAARHNLAELGRDSGIGAQMLRNKLNPAQDAKFSPGDLIALYHVNGDETLIDGMLLDCGLTATAIPSVERAPSLTHQVIDTTARVAGLGAQALTVVESGRVTKHQRNALVGAATVAMGNLALLIDEIEYQYQAVPTFSCALELARTAVGA